MAGKGGIYAAGAVVSLACLVLLCSIAGAEDGIIIHADQPVGLRIKMQAVPRMGEVPFFVDVRASIDGGVPPYTYTLRYGDGEEETDRTSNGVINTRHRYTKSGVYMISLAVRDARGKTGIGRMAPRVVSPSSQSWRYRGQAGTGYGETGYEWINVPVQDTRYQQETPALIWTESGWVDPSYDWRGRPIIEVDRGPGRRPMLVSNETYGREDYTWGRARSDWAVWSDGGVIGLPQPPAFSDWARRTAAEWQEPAKPFAAWNILFYLVSPGHTKHEVINVLGRPARVVGLRKYRHGIVEVWEYDRWIISRGDEGREDKRPWLYFMNDKLFKWAYPGNWQAECDRVYQIIRNKIVE